MFGNPRTIDSFLARDPAELRGRSRGHRGPCLLPAGDDARDITGSSLVIGGGREITGCPDVRGSADVERS